MSTHVATAIASGATSTAADQIVEELRLRLEGALPKLVLVFASPRQSLTELMPRMVAEFPTARALGCSTAGEFIASEAIKGGVCVVAVAGDLRVFAGLAEGLKEDPVEAARTAVGELPEEVGDYPYRTALLLVDPLAGNGEEITLLVAAQLGSRVRLAGGAAGDDLQMTQTFVAVDEQVRTNALAVATVFSKSPIGVGVCHGHRPYSRKLRVTRAQGGTVEEIDDRPAWTVWKEVVRERALKQGIDPEDLTEETIGGFLLQFEAGLEVGDEIKVRAPLALQDETSIVFACGMPEGTVFRITESEGEAQLSSAREAALRARNQVGDGEIAGAVVFDCICRNLILGDRFAEAVAGISDALGGAPLAGFETYGEIALDVGELSGFHNTTTVVLVFPRG